MTSLVSTETEKKNHNKNETEKDLVTYLIFLWFPQYICQRKHKGMIIRY